LYCIKSIPKITLKEEIIVVNTNKNNNSKNVVTIRYILKLLCCWIDIMIIYSFWANRLYKRFTNLGRGLGSLVKKQFWRMQLAADVIIIRTHTHQPQLAETVKIHGPTHARRVRTHALEIIILNTRGKTA